MTQHTQGEWEVCNGLEVLSEHGRFIAHVGYKKGETDKEDEANARLIASAPKLLESAKRMCKAMNDGDEMEIAYANNDLETAIAAAKGEA